MIRAIFLMGFVWAMALGAAASVVQIEPLDGAPYSSSAKVSPAATLIFTKSYAVEGQGFAGQAAACLEALREDLGSVGLGMDAVVNVRGYLKSAKGEDLSDYMAKWSIAYTEAFEEAPHPPTRTTIGVTSLQHERALFAMDAVVAAPPETVNRLKALWSNQRAYQPKDGGSSLRAAMPYSSLLITSGVLADAVSEESREFGAMEHQTASVLSKLEAVLGKWGLGTGDLLFVRAMLSPVPQEEGETEGVDWPGFEAGWAAYWENRAEGPPPLSAFAAPGFGSTGRSVEIEFYAVFPEAAGPFQSVGAPSAEAEPMVILREGSPTSFLSSSVAVRRDASLTWFAGVIDRERADIYGQGMGALINLEERMGRVGVEYPDVVQLRVYLNIQDSFRREFGEWNRAYRRFFDHEILNPTKPVRTAFPIETLPAGALIEVEALAVTAQ